MKGIVDHALMLMGGDASASGSLLSQPTPRPLSVNWPAGVGAAVSSCWAWDSTHGHNGPVHASQDQESGLRVSLIKANSLRAAGCSLRTLPIAECGGAVLSYANDSINNQSEEGWTLHMYLSVCACMLHWPTKHGILHSCGQ